MVEAGGSRLVEAREKETHANKDSTACSSDEKNEMEEEEVHLV